MNSHVNQNDPSADDDRFFKAVRYLLDEMSPTEAERFESQLAEDQSLRELLAEAVLLTETTYQTIVPQTVPMEPVQVASPQDAAPWNGYVWGILVTLAASLVVAVTLGISHFGGETSSDLTALSPNDMKDVQVAAAWVENIESQTTDLDGLWEEPLTDETDSLDQLLAGSTDSPPSWMLKALAAQQEDDPIAPAM
ncbi:hypothetical protein [Bremerella cremea]|uniref:hypothetical protein n=1 Tax=Bremerella cremea TaxID=1031537 RepID=UPI0031E92E68